MNRRARLTLISVCLVALLAGAFSAYYLKAEIERQFKFALDRADLMKRLASDNVARSLESQSVLPSPQAEATPADLTDRLRTIMAVSRSLLEITVCDPANKVLLSTDASRHVGDPFPEDYPDYGQLATGSRLIDKIKVLKDEGTPKYYQLTEALGAGGQRPELYVHVVILPALLRKASRYLVMSGILADQKPEILSDLRDAGIGDAVVSERGEWISVRVSAPTLVS